MKKSEFTYTLSSPIEYHHKGDKASTDKLVLKAPCKIHMKDALRVQKSFGNALAFFQKQNTTSNDTSVEEKEMARLKRKESRQAMSEEEYIKSAVDELLVMLMMADIDTDKMSDDFDKLMLSSSEPIALLDNVCPITTSIYSKVSFDDCQRILGEYIINFLSQNALTET